MGAAMIYLAWRSSAELHWVVSYFLARPVERKCYSVEPEDLVRPSFKAIVYSRSWVRNSVNRRHHHWNSWSMQIAQVHQARESLWTWPNSKRRPKNCADNPAQAFRNILQRSLDTGVQPKTGVLQTSQPLSGKEINIYRKTVPSPWRLSRVSSLSTSFTDISWPTLRKNFLTRLSLFVDYLLFV